MTHDPLLCAQLAGGRPTPPADADDRSIERLGCRPAHCAVDLAGPDAAVTDGRRRCPRSACAEARGHELQAVLRLL
jgi:hypothetical protein